MLDSTSHILVGGTSAGANFSSVLSHLARDHKLDPPITGIYLGAPVVVHHDAVPSRYAPYYQSYYHMLDAPIIPRSAMEKLSACYQAVPSSPLYSSLLWPNGHSGLPRTYLQVCGLDPLRDDGLIYEEVLRKEAKVETRIDVYVGLPHIFNVAFPDLEASRRFDRDRVQGFMWLIDGTRE